MSQAIAITGPFDDVRSCHVRLLHEASRLGSVTVLLWSDDAIETHLGRAPKFPLAERLYFLRAVRFVAEVLAVNGPINLDQLPVIGSFRPSVWADDENPENEQRAGFCREHGLRYLVFSQSQLAGFPDESFAIAPPDRKKVVVTGCYDWLHSGHVRFFEEVSHFGDLFVIVGHDDNIRLLKGPGHPLLSQQERRYMVNSVRYVTQSLISTGKGWLDADPEILRIKPDIYAVNEDGDRGGKREYCASRGIEYLVLQRLPAPGLPQRTSTNLRGF